MDAPTSPPPPGRIDVLSLWRWTVPFHALLPLAIWGSSRAELDGLLQLGFFVIHLGFPVVLAVTYPRWEGQGAELVGLLIANHVVTFTVGLALVVAVS